MAKSFWFYVAVIGVIVILLVYFQGFKSDTNAVGPYLIQLGALSQGRDPKTGAFSNYPTTNKGGGPSYSQIMSASGQQF